MKIKIRQLSSVILIAFFILYTATSEAASNKIDLDVGYYSLTASSGSTSGTISNPGIYRVGYRRAVSPRVDIGIGYTILFTKIISGDTGFGLDINGTYYFLGASSLVESQGEHSYLAYTEDLRPYVSLSFAQRNYQSIQTSYAGFGASAGIEKNLVERLSAKISARYNMLSAGDESSAKELSFSGGIVIEF